MKTVQTLRPTLSGLAVSLSAGVASGVLGLYASSTYAQTAATQTPAAPGESAPANPGTKSSGEPDAPVALPTVTVEAGGETKKTIPARKPTKGHEKTVRSDTAPQAKPETSPSAADGSASTPNALETSTGLNSLPGTLQSLPQTATAVSQQTLKEQQATTVDQALRNVPGITLATGEGGGGMNGDQFRIRGFDAKGDVYVDGLRDFGAYTRDTFATENVLVLKGSSSESFGDGTTGGVIELEQKKAHLGDLTTAEVSYGSGPLKRTVVDVNKQIGATTAVRLVGMAQDQDVVDRDHVYSDRWGGLASIAFGLGTDQTFTVNYFHQHGDRTPDMGVPIPYVLGDQVAKPVTEYGVPRSNYYGKETDRDLSNVDMVTALYRGKVNDWLTITNDTRYAQYWRSMLETTTLCMITCTLADVAKGNLNVPYTVWLSGGPHQLSTGTQNITTALADFTTGPFRHQALLGVDAWIERNDRAYVLGSGAPAGTLLDPNYDVPAGYQFVNSPANAAKSQARDIGLFASDRLWLTQELSLVGGVRWDDYDAEISQGGGPKFDSKTQFGSPKASVIWEPTPAQTYYFSWAKSFTPQGADIATSFSFTPQTQPNLKPENNETYEIGAKWSLLQGRLGATAALFQVEKDNATYSDGVGGTISTSEKQRVRGLELGLTGAITRPWIVQAAYTYMDSDVLSWAPSTFEPFSTVGNEVPYVSKHGASLWTTYDIATLMRDVPGKLLVGAGVNYRSQYFANSGNNYLIPDATTLDGLVSYELNNFTIALNGYNLTDELTYSSAFYYRAVPVPGRAFTLTLSSKF